MLIPPAHTAYGRYLLPHHKPHGSLVDHAEVKHTFRRVFLKPAAQFKTWAEAYETTDIVHSEDVQLTEDEIAAGHKHGGRWIFYSVWEMESEPEGGWEEGGKGRGKDLILIHGGVLDGLRIADPPGLSDYGLRYCPHVLHFLKAGFRVILPDLPSVSWILTFHSADKAVWPLHWVCLTRHI